MRKFNYSLLYIIFLFCFSFAGFSQTITITTPIEVDDIVNAAEATTVTVAGTSAGGAVGGTTVDVTIGGVTLPATISGADGPWTVDLDISGEANGPLTVSAVYDPGGAAIAATNDGYAITLDQADPSITGVTTNLATISDSDAGGTNFYIEVAFNEPMIDDGSQDPSIAFDNGAEDPSTTLSVPVNSWPNNQTFRVTYTVSDADVDLADIDVLVSGGQDLAGNGITVTNTDQNDLFSIDTENPNLTLVSFNPSNVILGVSDALLVTVTDGGGDIALTANTTTVNGIDVSSTIFNNSDGTYDFTYTVNTTDTDRAASAIPVSFILSDGAGNASNTITTVAANTTGVDATEPSISGVSTNLATISDSDAGGTNFYIEVAFNEPMIDDGSQDPSIAFDNGAEDPSTTLSVPVNSWPNNQTFRVTYTVSDANVDLADIDVLVSGGQDLAGNGITVTNADQNDLFSIDTENPSITGVTTNLATISDSDAGGTNFYIEVAFNEPLIDDGSQDPSIAFDNGAEDPSTTLSVPVNSWPNNQTFRVTYTVSDADVDLADIDVLVSGGQDLAGNGITVTNTDQNDLFSIDTENPNLTLVSFNPSNVILGVSDALLVTVTDGGGDIALTANTTTVNGIDVSSTIFNNSDGTYDFTYTVNTTDTDRAASAIPVSFILSDGAGNASNTITTVAANTTGVDATEPSISGVSTNLATISDSDAGGTNFYIEVAFNEPMIDDGSQDPSIAFDNGAEDPSTTLSVPVNSWPNNQTFRVTYTVSDANVDLADIDVLVSGGQDLAGNGITVTNADQNDLFSIDTENPSITGVTTNLATISDSDAGGTNFYIEVAFNEPMIDDGSQDPSIAFDNGAEDPSTTLSVPVNSWPNNQTFRVTYTVSDADVDLADIDVLVSGGQDLVGNGITVTNTDQNDLFSIDTQSPTFVDATFYDTDSDGSIDEILLEFSEDVDELTVSDADFNIGGAGLGSTAFTVFNAGFPAGNGVDASLTDNYVTLLVTITGTTDQTVAYTQGSLADEVGNLAATNLTVTTIDLAPPVIISAVTDDTGGTAGEIDQMIVVFSEDIDGLTLDTDGGSDDFIVTDGAYTYAVTTVAINGTDGATITLTERGSPDTGVTPDINLGIGDIEDLAPANNAITGAQDFTSTTDGAAPVMYDSELQASNAYVQVVFSEEIRRTAGGTLDLTDFDITINVGSAPPTTLNVTSINDFSGVAIGASEDTLRFVIDIDPSTVAYGGDDNITVSTNGTTIEDLVDILLSGTETAGPYVIQDNDNFPTASASYTRISATEGYITITFSENVLRDDHASRGVVLANMNNGEIRSGDWTNGDALCDEDELCADYTAAVSPITGLVSPVAIGDNNNSDIEWQDGSGTQLTSNNHTYQGPSFRMKLNDILNGEFRGYETYVFEARDETQIRAAATGKYMPDGVDYTFTLTFPDNYGDDFDDAGITAAAYDVNADGNIDEIVVTFSDDVDDATITASLADFTINGGVNNGVAAASLVATPLNGVDPNVADDHIFTLGFNSYSGTAVDGDLDFAGTLTAADDAGNLLVAGTVTITDAAGPVIQSAITADNDLNGQIDEITVTFSEPFADLGIDDSDFSLSGGYTIPAAGFAVASPDVVLTLNESGSPDTYELPDVTVIASILEDLSVGAADNPLQTFTNTSDGAAPYTTVNSLSSPDQTPDLSGTVDDPNATVLVNIGGFTRSAVNDGLGDWTLTNASNPFSLSTLGVYEVTAIGIDISGNNTVDVTSNEFTLTGGANITNATLTNICVSDGYQPLGDIQITETGTGDFGSSGTILLTLPSGFEFNPSAPASSGGGSTFVDIGVTYAFIGSATLQLTITYDGVDDGLDDVIIQGVEVQAVTGGASGNLERAGGTASLLTTDTNYATLSSNAAPADLTDLEETSAPGTPITSYTARFIPRVTITYTIGPVFTNGEDFVFSGGATGTMVPGTNIGTSFDMYLTSGTVNANETMTGQSSSAVGTTTVDAIGVSDILFAFTLDANPSVTANWYDGVGALINSSATNTNAALSATTPGLYTYDIADDNGTCESNPLRFNVLIYDDVHPNNDENTFINRSYSVNAAKDTIYISRPSGHTVNVTGDGISVVGGGADPLLAIFDPAVAGDDGAGGSQSHIITYSITNNTTLESESIQVTFEVVPESEFFLQTPENECVTDLPLTLTLDPSQYGPVLATDFQFRRFFFYEYMSDGGNYGSYNVNDTDIGGVYPWATNFTLETTDFSAPLRAVEPGEGSAILVERWTFDPVTLQNIFEYDYVFIYGPANVSLTNLSTNYCGDDTGVISFTRNLRYVSSFTADNPNNDITQWKRNYTTEVNQAITNGYTLEKWNGASYDPYPITGAPINTFNPSDPDNDGNIAEDETGQYRLTYTTENLTPANCSTSVNYTFNINPDTPTPVLDAATASGGGSVGFVDNVAPAAGIDDNEYLLEYCVGDIIASFSTSDVNTVRWYDDGFNVIPAFTGSTSIPPAAVGLSVSAGGFNAEQSVVFYFTSTDGTGCESDYRLVTVNTYDIPDNPIVDITGWPAAVEQGNTYWFEDCIPIGGSLDPANIQFDPLSAGEEYVVEQTFYFDANISPSSGYIYTFNVGGVTLTHSYGDAVTVPHISGTASGFVYSRSGGTMLLVLNTPGLTFNPGAVITNTTSSGTATIGSFFEQYSLPSDFINVPVLSSTGFLNYFLFTVSKTENINGSSNYAGCGGPPIRAYSIGWGQPTDVTTVDLVDATLAFHVSEGDALSNINHVTNQGMDGYVWYEDLAKTDTITALINGGSMTQDLLDDTKQDIAKQLTTSGGLVTDRNDDGTNDVYTYYITRYDHENEGVNAGFAGCESQTATPVTLTVHAIQPQPTVVSDNTPGVLGTPDFIDLNPGPFEDNSVDHFFSICVDQLESGIRFVASEATNAATPREFRWYVSDAGGTRGSLLPTDGSGNATFSELGLSGLNPPSTIQRYFEVIQVTDNDVYAGVESESTFVRVDISPQDALEFRDDVGAVIGDDFCRDDAAGNVIVDLFAGGSSAGAANVDYEIDSYLESTYLAASAPEVDGPITPGNPTLDIDALHDAIPGALAVGGEATIHEITMYYNDPVTLCTGNVTKTITIHPDPTITFLVDGTDIGSFVVGDDQFCYEDGIIKLLGNPSGGTFTSSALGALPANGEGGANFNTVNEHNAFHAVTGTAGEFLNQSAIIITYDYTDANGCDNSINTTLYVNPQPEVLGVTGLATADLAEANSSNYIRISDFCSGSSAVTAEIQFIDPTDTDPGSVEEDDYSSYTFTWTVGGAAVTDLNLDGLDNTIEFIPPVNTLNFNVVVTDLNGCSETFNESHTLQTLPSLDIVGITDNASFCANDLVDPSLSLTDATVDGSGATNTVSAADVISWSVDSYNEVDGAGAAVTIASGSGSFPTVNLDVWHTDGTIATPGTLVGGNATYHMITIVYQDPVREYQGNATNCSNSVTETIIITPDPDISITLDGDDIDDLQFCYDDINIVLQGVDLGTGLSLNGGALNRIEICDENGMNCDLVSSNGQATFNAATYHGTNTGDEYLPQSEHTIIYTYRDGNNCENVFARTFFVNPRPRFVDDEIKAASTCASASVELFVDMTDNVNDYSFVWFVNGQEVNGIDVIDEDGNLNDERITYDFGGQLTANFGVTATYTGSGLTTSCNATISNQSITVGEEPIPSVSWVGITSGNPLGTDFTITEDNATLPDADVNLVQLTIDGNLVVNDAAPILPISYNHSFLIPGSHTISLLMNTVSGCGITINRTVDILPHYASFDSNNAYNEDFENASSFDLTAVKGGWYTETRALDGKSNNLLTSWTRGASIPGVPIVNNGTSAVYTAGYQESEISFVYSPSFDLNGFSAPTISFLRYEDFETFRDGVVFQISEDDGRTWRNVGTYDAALEDEGLASTPGWYNREAITSAPGTQSIEGSIGNNAQGVGWALQSDWKEAISPISVGSPPNYVRFRFALAAQAGVKTTNGFGFDLVQIYDRDQIALVELFSSSLNQNSVTLNRDLPNEAEYTGSDVIILNYFTDLANGANSGIGNDVLNERNKKDPGARTSFYGVPEVPYVAISGTPLAINGADDPVIKANLSFSKLENPGFSISLDGAINAENELSVTANYTATTPYNSNTELGLFIAIVEPQITLTAPMGLFQAGDVVRNVLRKLLPSSGGKYVSRRIDINDVLTLDTTWTINNMYDPSNFLIVAFIQDMNTKKILQAEPLPITGGNNVLGVEDELKDINLYPNPANNDFTVEFARQLSESAEWALYDQAGREILKGNISRGMKSINIQTSEVPSGLYFIHLYGEERKRELKRVIVIH